MTRRKAQLGEIFNIGSSKRVLQSQWKNEGVPFYRGREITKLASEGFVNNELFISEDHYREYAEKYGVPQRGDIMVTAIGTIGNSYIVREGDRFYFKDASVLWLKKISTVSSEFINLWLKSSQFYGQLDTGNGATVDTLTIQKLKSVLVDLPPLPEQQRIVGILDEAFDGIATAKANVEENLKNARNLLESHLESLFVKGGPGWVKKPLAELCEPKRGITYGVIKLGDETPDGVPCLRTSNVRWLRIETAGMKRIAPALSSDYSRTILQGGEVLVNVRGTLGGVAVVAEEMAGWNVSREVAVVPVDQSKINPEFLSFFIGSGASQKWLGGVKKGATYIGINLEDLRLLPVTAPVLREQLEVVQRLRALQNETQRLESIYQKKLAALGALNKSLLDQAFSGQL
jgi:type I restriction enzyme, S subunit